MAWSRSTKRRLRRQRALERQNALNGQQHKSAKEMLFLSEEETAKSIVKERNKWIAIRTRFTHDPQGDFFGGEYDKLCADPRVAHLEVGNSIRIKTSEVIVPVSSLKYGSIRVYLGTYVLKVHMPLFGLLPTTFEIVCVDSGRYTGELRHRYYFSGGPGTFCFGDRNTYIKELLSQGEFFVFCNVVLESLWHINLEDYGNVLKHFRKVAKDGSVIR